MPAAMSTSKLFLLIGLTLCFSGIQSRRSLVDARECDHLNSPSSNGRELLDANNNVSVIYNEDQFVLALINPLVVSVIVASPAILLDNALLDRLGASKGLEFPVTLRRNVSIQGDASLPELPTVIFMTVTHMFRLVPGCTMTFSNVISSGLRAEDNPVQIPGLDLLAVTIPENGVRWSLLAVRDSIIIMPACYEASTMVAYLGNLYPPEGFPPQNFSFPVAQEGCVNNTDAPVAQRCWPLKGRFESYYFRLSNRGYDGSLTQYNANLSVVNTTVFCRAAVDAECSARTGNSYSCFTQLLQIVSQQLRQALREGQPSVPPPPSPPPVMDTSLPPSTGNGTGGSGSGGGGGGESDRRGKDSGGGGGSPGMLAAIIGGALGGAAFVSGGIVVFLVIKRKRHQRLRAKTTPIMTSSSSSPAAPAASQGTTTTATTTTNTTTTPSGSVANSRGAGADGGGRSGSSGSGSKGTTTTPPDLSPSASASDEAGAAGQASRGSKSGLPQQASDQASPPLLPSSRIAAVTPPMPLGPVTLPAAAAAAAAAGRTSAAAAPAVLITPPEEIVVDTAERDASAGVAPVPAAAAVAAADRRGGPGDSKQQSPLQSAGTGGKKAVRHSVVTPNTPPRPGVDLEVRMEECLVALAAGALDDNGGGGNGDGGGGGGHQQPGDNKETVEAAAAASPIVHLTAKTLGKGAFGRVVEGTYRGERVAVKIVAEITQGAEVPEALVKSFQQDVQVLSRCHHPNVVRLLAACAQPPRLCLVMELMDGSLDKVLYGGVSGLAPGELMPLSKVLYVGAEVARALAYLHPTVVHRDLKPGNVLLRNPASDRPEVKLTDFGLARLRTTLVPTKHPDAGTPPYMAPECFDVSNNVISHKADIYSLGVLLWEMLAGTRPWAGIAAVAIAFMVTLQNQRPPLEAIPRDRVSSKLLRLLCQCWDADPQRRPGADEVAKELTLAHQQLQQQLATTAMTPSPH